MGTRVLMVGQVRFVMRFGQVVLCVAVFAGGLPEARAADQPPLPADLSAALTQPEHRAALLQAAHAVDPPGAPACPGANYVATGEVGLLSPLQTDSSGKVTAGAWKETVRETGCGAERLLNAVTAVGPDGALQTRPMLPGTTITDPQLQQDSVRYAAGGIGAMPPGCQQGGIVNTRYVGLDGQPPGTRPAPGSQPRPWTEIWSLQACAKHAEVEMHFAPDASGTEVRATPVKQ